MQILVTGGTGFIGSNMLELLTSKFNSVSCFANEEKNLKFLDPKVKEQVHFILGDVRNYKAVLQATKNIDYIFHLAALISVPESFKNPQEYLDVNTTGTLNVLQAAHENDVKKVVLASSAALYGPAKYLPVDENHTNAIESPYAASKLAAESLLREFNNRGLATTALRMFNVYGPRQTNNSVLGTAIEQSLVKDTIELGNLAPTRDFVFVRDVAEAFLLATTNNKTDGEIINIASGKEITVKDCIDLVISMVGRPVTIKSNTPDRLRPVGEIDRSFASIEKAQRLMNWTPKTNIKDGLAETMTWAKSIRAN